MPSAHAGTAVTVRLDDVDAAHWAELKQRHGGPKRAFKALLAAAKGANHEPDDDLPAALRRAAAVLEQRDQAQRQAEARARARFAGAVRSPAAEPSKPE